MVKFPDCTAVFTGCGMMLSDDWEQHGKAAMIKTKQRIFFIIVILKFFCALV
jgi:hypothetical protein